MAVNPVIAGTAFQVSRAPEDGQLTFWLYFPGSNLDKLSQYYTIAGSGADVRKDIFDMLLKAKKSLTGMYSDRDVMAPAGGTVVGVYTMYRKPTILESIMDMNLPSVSQPPSSWIASFKCPNSVYENIAPDGFWVRFGITGLYVATVRYLPIALGGGFDPPEEYFGALIYNYMYPKAVNPPRAFVDISLGPDEPEWPDDIKLYRLYHVTKIGAEISPPHETVLFEGQHLNIDAYPLGGRTLTLFEIDGVEQLPGAVFSYPDLDLPGITKPEDYPDGLARTYFGPVKADVYVSAIADAYKIPGSIPQEIQMTTTDCLVEEGSWELGDTNLPEGVHYAIDENGLITITIDEDKWDGVIGGEYYLEVIFNGYSQTKAVKLLLTVADFPAFGTVWTPVTKLSQDIQDILLASDGTIYITGIDKIWSTTDLVTFNEEILTGTVDTRFGFLGEASDGRIVAMDKSAFWLKDTGATEFVRQAAPVLTSAGYYITADKNSSTIFISDRTGGGGNGVVHAYDLDNSTASGPFTVITGLNGWVYSAGVRADDGSWVFTGGKTNGYSLARISGGVVTIIETGAAYANHQGRVFKEVGGRIYFVGQKNVTNSFSRYSDDNGLTWSAEVTQACTTNPVIGDAAYLKPGYSLYASLGNVFRSTDGIATSTNVQTLDGTISSFCRLDTFKILAGTDGSITNLYISEA